MEGDHPKCEIHTWWALCPQTFRVDLSTSLSFFLLSPPHIFYKMVCSGYIAREEETVFYAAVTREMACTATPQTSHVKPGSFSIATARHT